MKPSIDRLLEIQHELASAIAEANEVGHEAMQSNERYDALTDSFRALRARADAAEVRAGAAGDTDAAALTARADFEDIGCRLALEILREEEILQELEDRLALVSAEIDEAGVELHGDGRRGIFWLIKVLLAVLVLAELSGFPILEAIRGWIGDVTDG